MSTERHYLGINPQALALSSAIVMGVVYIVCAGFTFLFPSFALQLFGWIFYLIDLDKFTGGLTITTASVLIGLIQIVIYTYIGVLLVAWLYNRLSK